MGIMYNLNNQYQLLDRRNLINFMILYCRIFNLRVRYIDNHIFYFFIRYFMNNPFLLMLDFLEIHDNLRLTFLSRDRLDNGAMFYGLSGIVCQYWLLVIMLMNKMMMKVIMVW